MTDTDAARAAMGPMETWLEAHRTGKITGPNGVTFTEFRWGALQQFAREQDAALLAAQQQIARLREALEAFVDSVQAYYKPTIGAPQLVVDTKAMDTAYHKARTALAAPSRTQEAT